MVPESGHPETKEYLMKLVNEVITRYDVDGVHFDYLRYQDCAISPITKSFVVCKRQNIAQWRRDNLTDIVRYIYKGVKAVKPWVK